MSDGTLRAELDFEPAHAVAAFRLLGSPGQPVAVAALKTKAQQEADDKPKGGVWSQWLAIRCGETEFQDWLAAQWPSLWAARGDPAEVVRCVCEVASRAEIDNDPEAQARFQERIRGPWAKHYGSARA